MAITISGSGITSANIADGTITSADLASGVGAGKVLQVIEVNTGSEIMTSSTYNSTGGYVTITPSATTSKIYVIAHAPHTYNNGTEPVYAQIWRGTSGEGSGSSIQYALVQPNQSARGTNTMIVLDEPASTSALTYTVMHKNSNNSTLVGWQESASGSYPSLTVMEIGA